MSMIARLSLLAASALAVPAGLPAAAGAEPSPREIVSLDGAWQIASGALDSPPASFDRTAPVPGLVSLAEPAFDPPPGPPVGDRRGLANKDPARDAFWYRRTFTLDRAAPAVAEIKVRKAMFGAEVVLNGSVLGYHAPSFTPGYFDARAALRQGENTILIRVGADRNAVGPAVPSGFDFEKERYIPGIFDSVELILSGNPNIEWVQAAPDIAHATVRVQALLRNGGPPATREVSFVVREAASGRIAGRLDWTVALAGGGPTIVDARVPIDGCRLWSPEDPFLYRLEVGCGSDASATRFGMREFHFDPSTHKGVLNGKPYFLRGSNFTLYRFFEDGECRDRPWNPAWVRLLHERVKDMHWNCLRYCIGFPPEAWYDAADELGILIDDEFPVWFGGPGWANYPKEVVAGELAAEYAEWVRERWNHPCVVIWDADNETVSEHTAPAIRSVRGLDLSGRPWSNSYTPPDDPGDMLESHPYHFQKATFKLSDLETADPVPQGNVVHNDGTHGVVINEYGWLWLNRDGTPTTLTRELYDNLLGKNSTTAQRRHLYALYLAAETEFWRAHREAAAVMHFTTLGYSRPDGQTSDHWSDVGKLVWEPEFYRYVRGAFSPVGLMVDWWRDTAPAGAEVHLRVLALNDLEKPWNGPIALRLRKAGAETPAADQKQNVHLGPFEVAETRFNLAWPRETGSYVLEATLRGADGETVRSVRELVVR